jgi:hypothetical protein
LPDNATSKKNYTMKKITLLTTFAFVFIAVACVKKPPEANCGKLPCPTAKGANVVSCYVNGVPYIAKGGKPNIGMFTGCQQGNYITSSALGGVNTTLNFYFCSSKYSDRIYLNINDSLRVGKYILNAGTPARAYLDGALSFRGQSTAIDQGELEITTLTNKVIAGTFSFKVKHDTGYNDVTEGNFDLAR